MKLSAITKTLTLAIGTLLFSACGSHHSTAPVEDKPAVVKFHTVLVPVGQIALAKTSTITLTKLILVFSSSVNDTVRDTLTTSTPVAISATSTTAQTINKNYSLAPLRDWKLVAKTLDSKDSVIHKDSTAAVRLNPADTAVMNLTLNSKYTMYEAKFLNIPDSISSSVGGTTKDALNLKRFVLKVDGITVVDSTKASGYFTPLTNHTLSFDYVTVGSHTIALYAYTDVGGLHYWDASLPLYSGSTVINVTAGSDLTQPLTLTWVGPLNGTGKLSVTIGKVGKVTVNGSLTGTVIN